MKITKKTQTVQADTILDDQVIDDSVIDEPIIDETVIDEPVCEDLSASTNMYENAICFIKSAIDELAEYAAQNNETARDAIANLSVILLDLQ